MKRLALATFILSIATGIALAEFPYENEEHAALAGARSSCAAMNGGTVIILATGLCAGLFALKNRRL